VGRRIAVALLLLYRATLGGLLGGRCRFYPSCSEYAVESITEHGAFKGGVLAARRFVRCGPWSRGGVDMPPGHASAHGRA
jgi:putative membrane protein insertion efficiency factor